MQGSRAQGGTSAVDPLIDFERQLLKILAKFQEVHTMAIGNDEINRFMMQEIREHEHMVIFMNKLSSANDHMKAQQKKEYIKIYGKAATIFEEALIPYLQKLLSIMLKKAKEGQPDLHTVISDTLGMMVFHIVQKADDPDQQQELLQQILKVPYTLLIKTSNKNAQSAGAMCLSKIVQNTRNELLWDNLEPIMDKIVSIFKSNTLRAATALLESLIAIVFYLEDEFSPFVDRFVPVLIEQISSSDWNTQKVGIDAVNALTTTVADCIIPHRVAILQALKPTRVHKMKPVREASQWTIKLLKESQPPLEGHELAILEDNPAKAQASQRSSIRGDREQKSPIRSGDQSVLKATSSIVVQTPGPGQRPSSRQGNSHTGSVIQEARKSASQMRGRSSRGQQHESINVQVLVPESHHHQTIEATPGDRGLAMQSIDISQQLQPSGRKVSQATLKRRQKVLEEAAKNDESRSMKSVDKPRVRNSLFQRVQNSTFFKQDTAGEEVMVLEPKAGKPPLGSQTTEKYQTVEVAPQTSSAQTVADNQVEVMTPKGSQQRKTKAQRRQEREMRMSSRQDPSTTEENEESGLHQRNRSDEKVMQRTTLNKRKFINQEFVKGNNIGQDNDGEGDSDIKIYEPKSKRQPPQQLDPHIERSQAQKADTRDERIKKLNLEEFLKDEQGSDREENDHNEVQSEDERENSKGEVQQHERSEDQIMWPTRQQASASDGEEDQQVQWPTKHVQSNKKGRNQDKKSDLGQASKQRYHQTEDHENNFMSDNEPSAQKQRLSKYITYDTTGEAAHQSKYHHPTQVEDEHIHHRHQAHSHALQHDFYSMQNQRGDRSSSMKRSELRSQYYGEGESRYMGGPGAGGHMKSDSQFMGAGAQNQFAQQTLTPTTEGQRTFLERAKWVKEGQGFPTATSTGMRPMNQFSATQDVKMNNFMSDKQERALDQTANAFDHYAYQSLSESLQMALRQIDQLNNTVKMMHGQMTKMQTEKTQLATKVNSLEQLVLQLSMLQAQRNSQAPVSSVFDCNQSHQQQPSQPHFNLVNMAANTVGGAQAQFRRERSPLHISAPQQFQHVLMDGSDQKGFSPSIQEIAGGGGEPLQTQNSTTMSQFSVLTDPSALNAAQKLLMQVQNSQQAQGMQPTTQPQPQQIPTGMPQRLDSAFMKGPSVFGGGGMVFHQNQVDSTVPSCKSSFKDAVQPK